VLQCVAVASCVVAVCCRRTSSAHTVLQCVVVCCSVLQCVAVSSCVVAVCCRRTSSAHTVLQCVVVCCSVLQWLHVLLQCVADIHLVHTLCCSVL